ncbi:ribonuclease P protein component 1 [Hyperthermus butylicus]|uniref:Ribonuclease P protein component 1 n=1 Tax=Hyperthermus butylicus (strain DSM 5456 / JCM 9403 / PLM1-5) TaxID=415426 RepID=RNP1_HYPBU|nr:ribonuclease P protein subunit [Hyperthermus butylicus]A2BMC7.1 RecName: Full=Ribonuclease P protein component 1; Short=RNase P component 1; AltName: Full=Rpp29 [Hyperthermus butylicus DSM 5456]ABM81138.1 ribonuclease P protein component 1 [Hyperthermus butylicus DSM 5456]
MKRTAWNIVFHSLIGLRARVLATSDPGLRGLEGVVVEETRHSLVVETRDGRRVRVLKANSIFLFQLPGGSWVVVRGEEIAGSLAERVKRLGRLKGVGWLVRAGEKRRYTRG